MVIYFSGTGNSKYVAEAIADRLKDEVVCANDYIKSEKKGDFQSVKAWVFVYPVYVSTIAKIFADFVKQSRFEGSKDAYFVGTCASEMGASSNEGANICKILELNYKGTEKVAMPQNYIALFKMTEPEECEKRIKASLGTVDTICDAIKNGKELDMKLASSFEYAGTRLVEKMYNGPFTGTKKFYATDACIGCGLCEKACALNNITMEAGKPKWIKSCVHCMACINRCPKQAIEYGKKTIGKQRYVCEKYVKQKA